MKGYRIGIDVGPTNIWVGLFNGEMELLAKKQTLTDQSTELDRLLCRIEEISIGLLSANGLSKEDLCGVGAVFPSYIDYAQGIVLETSYMNALSNAPIRALLEARFGVKVALDNDSNAAALAEHRLGAGVGHDNLIYAELATGIGGGIIINGRLYRGMHGMAGEIGHIFVSDSKGYPCTCGVTGCVQSISSGAHMARYATDRIKEGEDSAILDYAGTFSNIDMVAVGKAMRMKDGLAVEVVNRGADYLGRMFHSLNQVFDINVFVYGGGVTKLGTEFIDRIISAYRRYTPLDVRYPAQFIPAKLGDLGSMYGAALLVDDGFGA